MQANMPTNKPRVAIVIDPELVKQVDEIAERHDRSRSWVIVYAVKKFIESGGKIEV